MRCSNNCVTFGDDLHRSFRMASSQILGFSLACIVVLTEVSDYHASVCHILHCNNYRPNVIPNL